MNRRNLIAAGVAGISAAAVTSASSAENPELEAIRALLKKHDDATTAHDLDAVISCFPEDGAVMGTGPGEMWAGHEELKVAYKHFFMVYDKGEQSYAYDYRTGDLADDMGWLMTSGTIKGKKDGKEFAYPINVSLTVSKKDDGWKIASMHFSTLTSGEGV